MKKDVMQILQETIQQEKQKGNKINKISFQVEFYSDDNTNIKTICYSGEEFTTLS